MMNKAVMLLRTFFDHITCGITALQITIAQNINE